MTNPGLSLKNLELLCNTVSVYHAPQVFNESQILPGIVTSVDPKALGSIRLTYIPPTADSEPQPRMYSNHDSSFISLSLTENAGESLGKSFLLSGGGWGGLFNNLYNIHTSSVCCFSTHISKLKCLNMKTKYLFPSIHTRMCIYIASNSSKFVQFLITG